METKLGKIFCENKYEADSSLKEKILYKVQKENAKTLNYKIGYFVILGLGSVVGFVSIIGTLISDLRSSGLYEYTSLMLSNIDLILSHGRDYLAILGETLPIFSLILALTAIFVFLFSFNKVTKQIIRGQLLLTT